MKRAILTLLAALLMFSSCGTYTLHNSKVLNNADMSSYKTFMIQPAEEAMIPEGLSMGDVKNIANAVSTQLKMRGYQEVSTNPDMIVYMAMSVKQVIETKDAIPPATPGFGYRYLSPRASYVHNYYNDAQIISGISKQGLLMVDIVDAKENIHVFCAEVSALADEKGAKVKDLNELNEAAALLFSRFPIPATSAK